jgi:hypothetical protein
MDHHKRQAVGTVFILHRGLIQLFRNVFEFANGFLVFED